MYNLISEGIKKTITQEYFITRNKKIYEGIDAVNIKIEVIKVEKQKEKRESSKRGIISVVGIFGFLLLVQKLGFFLTATAYLIFEFFMLEPRRNVKKMILLAVLAVVFSGAVYYLFRYRVYVRLPKGIWG